MEGKASTSLVRALVLLGLLVFPGKAFGFDTGHHSDLTREALREEGFGETAIKTVQVQNFLTDYFDQTEAPDTAGIQSDMSRLHFDNLFSTSSIRNYWGWLTYKTNVAVRQAAQERDPLKLLTVLGVSLHAVQDFYTHSNWVETHRPMSTGAYRTDTWFSSPPGPGSAELHTGRSTKYNATNDGPLPAVYEEHGSYTQGLNKDSYVRPLWDEAYVFAYSATREWINAVHGWVDAVDPGFWKSVQAVSVSAVDRAALEIDLNASYRLAEWAQGKGDANGHWKGSGSGSTAALLPFAASWAASTDSIFVRQFKERKVHRLLSDGLTGLTAPPAPIPTVPRLALDRRAIVVRTLSVKELPVGFFELKIDPQGSADFFARITVDGQTFTEAMQLDRSSVSPSWTAIRFVPTNSAAAAIRYELWDEDTDKAFDDQCDINPNGNKRELDFAFAVGSHLCSGDVSGLHHTISTAASSQGAQPQGDRAEVQFYVTERPLEGWQSLGGTITTPPASADNTDGRLEIFARGTDSALWHKWQLTPGGAWSDWASLGGSLTSNIAVGRNADGRLEVFALDGNRALVHKWQLTAGGQWSDWSSLGGYITSNPVVGQNKDGRLEVFVRGGDNALYHKAQRSPGGSWSDWYSLFGLFSGDPAVCPNADGRLEVFVRGYDGALYHRWQVATPVIGGGDLGGAAPREPEPAAGRWSDWASLGGYIITDPVVARNKDGRLEVSVLGSDGALYSQWQLSPGGGWSGYAYLGGDLRGNPALILSADGRLAVFVRGGNNALWHKWQAVPGGPWSDWLSLGGVPRSAIAAARNSDGRLEVFVQGPDGALWHRWQTAPGGAWN